MGEVVRPPTPLCRRPLPAPACPSRPCLLVAEWRGTPGRPHYFASTVADVFHSRRAYLHGPLNATAADGAATSVTVPAAGTYTVLVRYEAPYRFEVPFQLTVTQGGAKKISRVYGRRTNLKVWPFSAGRSKGSLCGPGLQTECAWPW